MSQSKKILIKIRHFFIEKKCFNISIAFIHLINPLLVHLPLFISEKIIIIKHRQILKYLYCKYYNILQEYKHKPVQDSVRNNDKIWVCWLQGEENMPLIVNLCYQNMRKKSNEHEVILISLNNYSEYVNIPDYIITKFQNGKISNTHFSDILRTCLLYEQGGVWIDATIWITQQLPNELFSSSFYSIKIPKEGNYISGCRWSNFFLCSSKGNIIFDFTRAFFFEYLNNEDYFIDYFLMDYFIYIGYIENADIRQQIDNLPVNNVNVHQLTRIMNKTFNDIVYSKLLENTYLFKLSWKENYIEDKDKTFWYMIRKNLL